MNGDWTLVMRGFVLAGMGAVSTILYIVALSAAYIGRFALSAIATAGCILLAFGFVKLIGRYLDAIDQREATESSQWKPPES